MSEYLPWLLHADRDLILCKDGSILCAFDVDAVDVDMDGIDAYIGAIEQITEGIAKLDDRFYAWMITDKRCKSSPEQFDGLQSNLVTQVFDEAHKAPYKNARMFTIQTRIFLVFTGDTGLFSFMESVQRRMNEEGDSLIGAFLKSLNPANNVRAAVLHDARQLDNNIRIMRDTIAGFVNAQTHVALTPLAGPELDRALMLLANPTMDPSSQIDIRPSLLDAALSTTGYKFGREVLQLNGPNRTSYASTLSLTGYPEKLGAFSLLLQIPFEFRITHVLKFMSGDQANKAVDESARYYLMTQSSLAQKAIAYMSGKPPEIDQGKADLYFQAAEALRRQTSENLGFSYHSMFLTFYGSTPEEAKSRAEKAMRGIGGRVPYIRERIGLKSATLSTIPGQWAFNKRLMLTSTEVVTETLPLLNIRPGNPSCAHLSEVYGKPVPALATFASKHGTEVHFDPFVGQVAHSLLVMPTGGGKTTFVNYCLSQFSRYPDARVIIFDRDRSCRIITHMMGGSHMDLSGEIKLNPMAHIRTSELEMANARDFIVRRVSEGGETLTAEDRQTIYDIIKMVAQSDQEASLNTVWTLLPQHIKLKTSEWVQGGPFHYFGSKDDDFSLSDWTCLEMKEIMKNDRLSRAFLDHAFSSIARMLDGRPTFIYVEEASFALKSPAFVEGITTWLQTFRKLNAMVWLTIQSPESVGGVENEHLRDQIRATISDNVPNIILGYNPRVEVHRNIYRHFFGLSDHQVNMIRDLTPKRDYLRISGDICRVMQSAFNQDMLALLRSEPEYQKLLDQWMSSGRDDWRQGYFKEATQRSKGR